MLAHCEAPLNLKQVFNELLNTGFGEFSVFSFSLKDVFYVAMPIVVYILKIDCIFSQCLYVLL